MKRYNDDLLVIVGLAIVACGVFFLVQAIHGDYEHVYSLSMNVQQSTPQSTSPAQFRYPESRKIFLTWGSPTFKKGKFKLVVNNDSTAEAWNPMNDGAGTLAFDSNLSQGGKIVLRYRPNKSWMLLEANIPPITSQADMVIGLSSQPRYPELGWPILYDKGSDKTTPFIKVK